MRRAIICCALTILPVIAGASDSPPVHHVTMQISTEQLKQWTDAKKPIVILDARSKQYFNGVMLPGAKWVPCEASENEIRSAVPDKNSTIVVYCAGPKCPASGRLADKLQSMGYHNVYEYRGGLNEWTKAGYPTQGKSS